jgi:hypothetical protein
MSNFEKQFLNLRASPYNYYLNLLGKWPTNIALASQWFIYFDFSSVNALKYNLQTQLRNRESSLGSQGWTYSKNVTNYLLDGNLHYKDENLTGCVFSNQVKIPQEQITAGNNGLSYGGFMPPATASTRKPYSTLSVNFLETNASFLDLIIRPWIILVGYNGLVARSEYSPRAVKCSYADIVMLAKTGSKERMGVRKIHRFYNLAPISIDGEEYSYMPDGLKYSNVSFVYDGYMVLDADTPNLINKGGVLNLLDIFYGDSF